MTSTSRNSSTPSLAPTLVLPILWRIQKGGHRSRKIEPKRRTQMAREGRAANKRQNCGTGESKLEADRKHAARCSTRRDEAERKRMGNEPGRVLPRRRARDVPLHAAQCTAAKRSGSATQRDGRREQNQSVESRGGSHRTKLNRQLGQGLGERTGN